MPHVPKWAYDARRAFDAGATIGDLTRRFGVGPSTLFRWLDRVPHAPPLPPPAPLPEGVRWTSVHGLFPAAGAAVREEIRNQGLTLKDVARRVGGDIPSLIDIFAGSRSLSLPRIVLLERALGKPPGWLTQRAVEILETTPSPPPPSRRGRGRPRRTPA